VIAIKKPMKAPGVLLTTRKTATLQFCAEHDADPAAPRGWKFDKKIYAAKSVKAALQKAQHDKCAF
jgi:hypothetical protein